MGWAVLAAMAAQRVAELAIARRNTGRLLAKGWGEVGRGHYPLFVVLHAAWLASVAWVVAEGANPRWPVVAALGVVLALRAWVMTSLGPLWTTRILTAPSAPLVRRGPYRWCRHPNYVVASAEIALLPLAFGAWRVALAFSLANAALLAWRIRVEERALSGR
jgi:methyltransferase